jgi:ribonuclease III
MSLIINRIDLEKVLKYITPRNIQVYQEVFMHKSALKKFHNTIHSNERLEFLGDVVFSLAVTDYLYTKYPEENEGFLTKIRIKIVKGQTLAFFATSLHIDEYLVVSPNTVINKNILENAFEALIGAIYLDYCVIGYEMVFIKMFVFKLLNELVDWVDILKDDNYKDILMRHAQKIHVNLPKYSVMELKGTPHSPNYNVTLSMQTENGNIMHVSKEAKTKKDAEQLCAKEMLLKFNISYDQLITG